MMIRSLILIGLLWTAVAPGSAHALTPLCESVLPLTPVSGEDGYVAQVLERSNEGIDYAAGLETVESGFESVMGGWALNIGSMFLWLLDNRLTLTQQSQDLTQQTACLNQDVLMLECQLDKIRDEINAAFEAGGIQRIILLQKQIPFLRERIQYLLRGADDPTFADPTWGLIAPFDKPANQVWCCESAGSECAQVSECAGESFRTLEGCVRNSQCTQPAGESAEESRLCPFSSDYGPAMLNGYGCDVSVMEGGDYASLTAERDALQGLVDGINAAATELGYEESLPREHKVVNGCMRKYGYCSEDTKVGCVEDVDCVEANAGTCEFDLPADAVWNPLHNPFTAIKDELGIMGKFLLIKEQEGFSRQFSNQLKNVDEFSSQQSSARDRRAEATIFDQSGRQQFRENLRNFARGQGSAEASPFAESTDAQLRMSAALPTTGVASDLRQVVTDRESGLRAFLVRYAYFARRTCMNRPCSQKLEQVLKLAFSDECYPYADGTYAGESEENPQWKECAKKACIPIGLDVNSEEEWDDDACVCYKLNQGEDFGNDPAEVGPDEDPDVCVPRP